MQARGCRLHLAIDGYGADPEVLQDADLLMRFLDEYPAAIGMTKLTPPQVYTYRGKTPEDWGISGFVIIAESHVSVHTFPDRGYVNVDVFSCKEFDPGAALEDVKASSPWTRSGPGRWSAGSSTRLPGKPTTAWSRSAWE